MNGPPVTTLRIAVGDYPHTLPLKRGEIASPWLTLDFVDVKPMNKAFKPMVREHAFDASEMALVTYFQAKEHNKGLTLLPAAMLARFQHGAMLFNAERGKLSPSQLPGRRIGVRSYSQTTGAWLLPGELAFAALAERQTRDLHVVAALGVQRDRPAGAPDEIARMGGDHEPGFLLIGHLTQNSILNLMLFA